MDAKDLFLLQHSAVHSIAVGGNPASAAERTFGGLSDDQWRVRPREDLDSVAWIMFHIARAEDIIVNPVIAGRDQVFSDRLGAAARHHAPRLRHPHDERRGDGTHRPTPPRRPP